LFKDWVMRGVAAGLIAGVAMTVANRTLVALNVSEQLYAYWGYVLVSGTAFRTLSEEIAGQLVHLAFCGFVGLAFTWLVRKEKGCYVVRAVLWSIAVWFASNAVITLFNVTLLLPVGLDTIISHLVTTVIYGLTLAKALDYLDAR